MRHNGYSTFTFQVPDEVMDAFDRLLDRSMGRIQKSIEKASPTARGLAIANMRSVRAAHRRHLCSVMVYLLDKASLKQIDHAIAAADVWRIQLEESNRDIPRSLQFRRPQGGK